MGYGKLHILVALVCLLSRSGKHVVYIPDCRMALDAPLAYIQSALLCALAHPDLQLERQQIHLFKSNQDALDFVRSWNRTSFYFVVDQANVLDNEDLNHDSATNEQKQKFAMLLRAMYTGHYSITSASVNYKTALAVRSKQNNQDKMELLGGLSRVRLPFSLVMLI
jgi:hypothetical protein